MARIFLTPGEPAEILGSTANDIFGTNEAEVVTISANAKASFNPSFNRGNDTINILGDAALYTARVDGSNLLLTANNGASILLPLGEEGLSIKFADASARSLYYDADLGQVILGSQQIALDGTPAAVNAGSGSGNPDPDPEPNPGDVIFLEHGRDNLVGTDGDDVFIADVVANDRGEQTNTLSSGDRINGGAGNDTLEAFVQKASPLNAGPSAEIQPITVDVENALFSAQFSGNRLLDGSLADLLSGALGVFTDVFGGPVQGVEINAARMLGLDRVGSVQSNESLTIYDLTTLTDSGDYADRRATESLTVRMDHTAGSTFRVNYFDDGGDALPLPQNHRPESDLTVLLDQNYLISRDEVVSGSVLTIELMDMDSALTGGAPLLDNPFGSITFSMGGETKTLTWENDTADTYPQLLAAIQNAIAEAALTDPDFAKLSATLGGPFTATDTDNDPGGSTQGSMIVITNSGPEELEALTMTATGAAPAGKDFHTNFGNRPADEQDFPITINVELDKVGRGSDGGDLTIGGMATDGRNWLGGGTGAVRGIEQFLVTVEGDETQPSSLASLASTNNALETIVVTAAEGAAAALTIGNLHTNTYQFNSFQEYGGFGVSDVRNNALKDVLTFDASLFNNGATVYGYFSQETVAKYLDLTDGQPRAPDDNVTARYSFGAGDDLLNINIAKDNLATVGTGTREDFAFEASMGAGDDHVQFQIGNGFNPGIGETGFGWPTSNLFAWSYITDANGLQSVEHWYYNHVINGNVRIDTGAGNDVVETWGATAADINLGDGDDVVYTDNSGQSFGFNNAKATWVVNAQNVDVYNLQSRTGTSVNKIANLSLTVTFQGISRTVEVADSHGSNGVLVTDLSFNQAIKDAIESDPRLSSLLIAEDGPARTLVIRSLIDGEHVESDLSFSWSNSGPLSTQQANAGARLFDDVLANGPGATQFGTRFASIFAEDGGDQLTGIDSINVNNNNVEGGLGNDLIVLSSNGIGNGIGFNSATLGNSVETVDINGLFGEDTILNFTAATIDAETQSIQTVTFDVPVDDAGDPDYAGTGTVTVTFAGTTVNVPVAANASAQDIAQAAATALNGQPSGVGLGAISATAADGVLTLSVADPGVVAPVDVTVTQTPTAGEVQEIVFAGDQASPLAADGPATTITITNGATTIAQMTIPSGETRTDVQIADELADNVLAAGYTVSSDGFGTLTVTAPDNTGDLPLSVVTVASSDVTVTATVTEETPGEAVPQFITAEGDVVEAGGIPLQGYDIFDVEDVILGQVQAVLNDTTDGIFSGPTTEADTIQGVTLAGLQVGIIDTVEQNDYAFDTAHVTELARITEIARDADTTASTSVARSIVITVNDNTNVGTFYEIVNGTAANDTTVARLGSVKFGEYDDVSKAEIGNWDQLTLTNFTPLSPNGIVDTFGTFAF